MTHRVAGVDVHKKMLAVVVANVAVEGEYQFTRQRVGTSPSALRAARGADDRFHGRDHARSRRQQHLDVRSMWRSVVCRLRPGAYPEI